MRLKCQFTDSNFKFDKTIQIESVPIELISLVNFILERIDLFEKSFSKESFALAHAMISVSTGMGRDNRYKRRGMTNQKEHIFPFMLL